MQKGKSEENGSIILVATYRGLCRDWIIGSKGAGGYYNIPFHRDNADAPKSSKIKIAFLNGDDESTIFCRLTYQRVVSRSELIKLGYPSREKAHSDKYILFKVGAILETDEIKDIIHKSANRFYITADHCSENREKHIRKLSVFLESLKEKYICPVMEEIDENDNEINVESLWLIGPRAKGKKRVNCYHGNFVPQIPNDLIRRFTKPGDLVLDMFTGSGTTLFECERLGRDFIGFDINEEIVGFVENQMVNSDVIRHEIHLCDITNEEKVQVLIRENLSKWNRGAIDFIMIHPPYLDIVQFTDKEEDLSNISDLESFIEKFKKAVSTCIQFLAKKKYFALVVGDIYRNSEVVPLGFRLMEAIKDVTHSKVKGILIKDMIGNRGKIGREALWRARALRGGYYLFKHEYVFVFRKER